MQKLSDFLKIENDSEILEFTFEYDDILMWPFIRAYIYEKLLAKVYKWTAHPSTLHFDMSFFEKASYVLKSFQKRPSINCRHYDIVMIVSGISNFRRDGFFFNKVFDYFAFLYEKKTVLIEGAVRGKYCTPRSFPNIYYQDMIEIAASLSARFQRVSRKDEASVERLIAYLRENICPGFDDASLSVVRDTLRSVSTRLSRYHKCYKNIFKNMKPQLILLEDASYGSRSYILKWAKENSIVTGEPQHGMLYKSHYAYNYGENIVFSGQYRKYLPDYFLTYGRYWNEFINLPATKVVIGSANYQENIQSLGTKERKRNGKLRILMVSSSAGVLKKIMLALSRIIDRDRYKIVFRPHPMERPFLKERYSEVLADNSIQIDNESNLYESLRATDYLVGEPSTVLYEAFGICNSIFVIDIPSTDLFFPQDILRKVKDADELYEEIKKDSGVTATPMVDIDDVWNAQWKENYKNFVESLGV